MPTLHKLELIWSHADVALVSLGPQERAWTSVVALLFSCLVPSPGPPTYSFLSNALKKMENAGIKAYTKSPDGRHKTVCVS